MKSINDLAGQELLAKGKELTRKAQERASASKYNPTGERGVCPVCGGALPSKRVTLQELAAQASAVSGRDEPVLESHPWQDDDGLVTYYTPCTNPKCVRRRREQEEKFTTGSEKLRLEEFNGRLRSAGIGARNMRGLTLEGFNTEWPRRKEHKEALRTALDQMTAWVNGAEGFALLSGPFGVGKTRLAVGALRKYLVHGSSGFLFASVEGWGAIKASWALRRAETVRYRDRDMTQAGLMGFCQESGLLVLDDVDKPKPSGAWLELLLGIVNYRTDRGLPIIFTFNTPLSQVESYMAQGDADQAGALWSRITQRAVLFLEFPQDQPDFRRAMTEDVNGSS